MNFAKHRIGRFTVAAALIAFGGALLVDNLGGARAATGSLLKFWPIILIGYGAEYLIFSLIAQFRREEVRLKFDIGGAILLFFLVIGSTGYYAVRDWVSAIPGHVTIRDTQVERTRNVSAPAAGARELEVQVSAGTVTLRPNVSDDEVRVEATYGSHFAPFFFSPDRRVDLDAVDVRLTSSGGVIRVEEIRPDSVPNVMARYTVYAPAGLGVKVRTGAGGIRVYGYKGGLQLDSGAGYIEVRSGAGSLALASNVASMTIRDFEGPVTARASAGGITVDNVNGPLQLESGTGHIQIHEFRGGKVLAETNTGRIEASTRTKLEGDVTLKANAGSVNLTVPGDSGMRVSAQTRTGSVNVPEFMTKSQSGIGQSAVGTTGDGAHTITLETGTGSVNFHTNSGEPSLR